MYIENLLANLSFCLLFCTMVFYWVQAIFFSNPNFFILGNFGMLCSNFCLLSLLLFRWQNSGHFPLSNLYESLIFLSWGITTIHLLLYQLDKKNNKEMNKYQNLFLSLWLGCVTSPTALFINTFASFSLPSEMQKPSALVPALQSNWLFMHVTVMIISYAALIIGCLLSFVFLIITRGEDINLKNSLFKKFFFNSINFSNLFFFNILSKNKFTDYNSYKHLIKNEKFLGNNLILIQNTFLILNNKNIESFKAISNKTEYLLSFKNINNGRTNKKDQLLIEKWLNKFNLSFDLTLEYFSLLIKTQPYTINNENMSLSFCYDRPIINIDNKNLFQKIYHSEEDSYNVRVSKNKKNLTYKIAKNLDNLSYRILGIGFPFLTIGILSGSVWANEAWGSYWSWDPKETWALLTWLVFAVYFHSRLIKGWEGKKPAILATFGFIVVWICFIGVNLLKSGLHSYGFFS
uniref:Cytochrome c biogenesis protein CcsA n=1 Tax=Oedogonium cardiacum TaxID=55995 RepID=B2X1U9_OEDCA|nr:cytochrome c biogenesis protein [Oedogonium cardiacum]ABU88162.1 heme attachment to plastid cytochrome c protein [Oedogonium cardiacum]ACC97211.1 heme attachment to plastid cytochrome c [Oedogonium cardiacum]